VIYVDRLVPYPHLHRRTGHLHWCHLLADSRDELHDFAARLGVERRRFQEHEVKWHYDIPEVLRARACALGATTLDLRAVAALLRARRAATGLVLPAGPVLPAGSGLPVGSGLPAGSGT